MSVIDLKSHRDRMAVERGEGGFFADPPADVRTLLIGLGDRPGPYAVGLFGAPQRCGGGHVCEGYALSADDAEKLGRALIAYAEDCRRGYP